VENWRGKLLLARYVERLTVACDAGKLSIAAG
jgi:hypothetical protein